jgi:glucans biosynthesis protein
MRTASPTKSQDKRTISAVCALSLICLGLVGTREGQADPQYARDGAFAEGTVEAIAKTLSLAPYAAPKSPLAKSLKDLDYDHYRDIRFRPTESVWRNDKSYFQLQMFHRGFLFADPVEIAIVKENAAQHLAYSPQLFSTGKVMTAALPNEDIGFAGLRVLYPLNRSDVFDEVAVFQGASYFRSLGRGQGYGLSARGLAIKTGDPSGEEFPAFRAFWVEAPAPNSHVLRMHALLDSPSTTGAYHFKIYPGQITMMEIEATLFPRVPLAKVGLAPGTSMFMFSGNGRSAADDFRPEVHDSDGLLIVNGRGEHLCRPLANPVDLQVSCFVDHGPQGFGLLQRNRRLDDYQDFESHYEHRPSLWTQPNGDWGDGAVVLTEIPSNSEIHDNIVAFWQPKAPLPAHAEYRFAYRLFWNGEPQASSRYARVLVTRRGRADLRNPTPVRLFVIDYASVDGAGAKDQDKPHAVVTSSAGEIRDVVVSDNPLTSGKRVSFAFDPKEAKLAELRVELDVKGKQRAETWVYRWTAP